MSSENRFADVMSSDLLCTEESTIEASDTIGCCSDIGELDEDMTLLKREG